VDIVFDGPPDLDVIKARAVECEGAYVRIQYAVDEEYRHNVDRAAIRLILEKAADLKIEGKILIVTRQRAQGISTVSMGDKLRLWATVTGTPDVDALGERLQLLETTPASEIAEALVAKVTAVA
jgi:exonuclease SbcD